MATHHETNIKSLETHYYTLIKERDEETKKLKEFYVKYSGDKKYEDVYMTLCSMLRLTNCNIHKVGSLLLRLKRESVTL